MVVEDTSLLVSDGTLQQPPKKKTKTDAVVKIERPAEGDESIVGLTVSFVVTLFANVPYVSYRFLV